MYDLLENILAASRKKPNDFSWVVPIIFVVFYGLSALARIFNKSQEDKPKPKRRQMSQEDRRGSQRWQEKATQKQQRREVKLQRQEERHQQQYKEKRHIEKHEVRRQKERIIEPELPAESSPEGPEKHAILKSMMEEVYRQAIGIPVEPATKAVSPKPVRRKPARKPAVKPVVKRKAVQVEEKVVEKIMEAPGHGLSRLENLNELKRAILYSEILGKPMSLRDI